MSDSSIPTTELCGLDQFHPTVFVALFLMICSVTIQLFPMFYFIITDIINIKVYSLMATLPDRFCNKVYSLRYIINMQLEAYHSRKKN
jgi:hypothetical protein